MQRLYGGSQVFDRSDHLSEDRLRIPVDQVAVISIEQLVLDAGITVALPSLDHVDLMGLMPILNVDQGCQLGAC